MKKLKAYNNDPSLKEKMIAQMKDHMEKDKIIKGTYGDAEDENFKGCAVGCALDSLNIIEGKKLDTSSHERYESELGIPKILAHLEDGLFEEMSSENSKTFPLRFLEAVPVGADLSNVFTKLVIWEWEDEKDGLKNIQEIKDDTEVYKCCEDVTNLYKRTLAGETVTDEEWQALEDLSEKIWAGVWTRTWTRTGAWTRAWTRAGARTGAWTRAWTGARTCPRDEYQKQIMVTAEKFLELLANAPTK